MSCVASLFTWIVQKPRLHRNHAVVVFVATIVTSGVLLPLIRVQPESVHKHFSGLSNWIRIAFILSLCIIFTGLMFKLLSPQIGHLAHWSTYPPAWLGAIAAWIVVAVIDLCGGFAMNGYHASVWEWVGYGGGSFLIVAWYTGLLSNILQSFRTPKASRPESTNFVTLQDIQNASWGQVEEWLRSNSPARYDFLRHQAVADRLSGLILSGTRFIGIVGPFGSGKTSLVQWTIDRLTNRENTGCKYLLIRHSCWGFETSASAIQDVLRSAIKQLGLEIDTFDVNSLPETYRSVFSAGGKWVETFSKLVMRVSSPAEQFSRLSKMLCDIGAQLVVVIEDLDRNDTRNFESQEVLAFLERLKEYPGFSFILTGGQSSSQRIDYSKLCEHIEHLKTIQPQYSSELIARIAERCLDNAIFPCRQIGDSNRKYEWNLLSGVMMRDYEEFSLPQAVASLLNTPRSLRHALGRTFSAWKTLSGEIDFNHLLAVNILRFGAPECFHFLLRRWDRLHSEPGPNSTFGKERLKAIRKAIIGDWNRTIRDVEWDPTAALRVMKFILPATECWLASAPRSSSFGIAPQGIAEERYWIRAVNDAIDEDDVRDQEVIRDIVAWLDVRSRTGELVVKLTSLRRYSDIWQALAGSFFAGRRNDILLLCEQVIMQILRIHGASACYDSQGFVHTWSFAGRRVSRESQNCDWLQSRISDAAEVSLEMVNGLRHFYGDPGELSILKDEDIKRIKKHIRITVKESVTSSQSLIEKLSPNASTTLSQIVFNPGNEGDSVLATVQSWSWLGPFILDAMRNGSVLATANCGILLSARVSRRERMAVDTEVLDHFFGNNASEVIDILESLIGQLPAADRTLVSNVIVAARQYFAGGTIPDEPEDETEAD